MTEHLEKSQQEDILQSDSWSGLVARPELAWALLERRGRGGLELLGRPTEVKLNGRRYGRNLFSGTIEILSTQGLTASQTIEISGASECTQVHDR